MIGEHRQAILQFFDCFGDLHEVHIFPDLPAAHSLLRDVVKDAAHHSYTLYDCTSLVDEALPIRAAFPHLDVYDHRRVQ